MAFNSMMTDTVDLIKKSGEVRQGIKASVQARGIYIVGVPDGLLIEPEDLVRRRMSNGAEETFLVVDPGFHEKFGGIPASYQMKVRKLGLPEAQRAIQHLTVNMNGHAARFNNQSVDNSTNVVTVNTSVFNHLQNLRAEIQKAALKPDEKNAALEIVDAIEDQIDSGKPKKSIMTALLASLPAIDSVTSIGKNIYDALHAAGQI
ncbi:hypothetical protein PSQ39_01885 [Curvibacter sp. HBC28]|uniref:AbiTii domain-containing protein n=1 Tax=Curvibacter microcysteis TaxID=3026419 RepID=A0ABT5M9V8_9BURK|nr:hypothetical protein [Curvibacter sp. HBC28]MDD0813371.1 hypothetical protein [Curvibacter sp. HBC28]